MIRVGLISDTHGYLDEKVFHHFKDCDEVWHAGDFGSLELVEALQQFKPLRAVWGNIDDARLRREFPERLSFSIDGFRIAMIHIGGYPGRYAPGVKAWLKEQQAQLFISGHSHIVKAVPDPSLNLLHLNSGAAGKQGWHKVRTIMRFVVADAKLQQLELIELVNR